MCFLCHKKHCSQINNVPSERFTDSDFHLEYLIANGNFVSSPVVVAKQVSISWNVYFSKLKIVKTEILLRDTNKFNEFDSSGASWAFSNWRLTDFHANPGPYDVTLLKLMHVTRLTRQKVDNENTLLVKSLKHKQNYLPTSFWTWLPCIPP